MKYENCYPLNNVKELYLLYNVKSLFFLLQLLCKQVNFNYTTIETHGNRFYPEVAFYPIARNHVVIKVNF